MHLRLSCTTNERGNGQLSWKYLTVHDILTNLYDQKADTQNSHQAHTGHEGQADAVRHSHGKHDPMYLRVGNGGRLYAGSVGQGSGQRRDFQNDFTRFFYSYRRHDWVPVWYQTHAE